MVEILEDEKVGFELKNKSEYRTKNEECRNEILMVTYTFLILYS